MPIYIGEPETTTFAGNPQTSLKGSDAAIWFLRKGRWLSTRPVQSLPNLPARGRWH